MGGASRVNAIVTGGSGFLGQHLVAALEAEGANVYLTNRVGSNLMDPARLCATFKQVSPIDCVFHLAADCGGIEYNANADGDELFHTNAVMGLNVLHAAYNANAKRVLCVGTVCSYPVRPEIPFHPRELFAGQPEPTNSGYGYAKRVVIQAQKAYPDMLCLNPILANLYGPGDRFHLERAHVIPAIILKVHEAMKRGALTVTLMGRPDATRDFLYVDDAVDALVAVAANRETSNPINIGTGIETSIGEAAAVIADEMGYTGEFIYSGELCGQPRRVLDVIEARDKLNWTAQTTLAQGIKRTVAWARENVLTRRVAV